jgi:hypothetical protein
MDDVERMYRHLVRTVRTSFPQYLSQPFEVGELYQTILPYRLHRRELAFETNQDYEIALLELLAGAQGYLVVDDRMRDVLSTERASVNPDTARIRDFASAHVAFAPEALQKLDGAARASGTQPSLDGASVPRASGSMPGRASTTTPIAAANEPSTSAPSSEGVRRATRPVTVPAPGDQCQFCKGALPPGRAISFCPHCGQDMTVIHCPACGSELERGWKFCVTCGRNAAAP